MREPSPSLSEPAQLSTLAHELRTPLNAMLGALSLLEGAGLSPQQADLVAVVQRAGEDMRRLLDAFLAHVRLEAGAEPMCLEPFDPAQEIAAVARLFEASAQAKGLALRVALDLPEGVQLLGDPLRLRQIVGNLVSNAVKFTSAGWVRLGGRLAGGELLVSVADTGPGIDAELRARLFQPFQQAHGAKHGGSGLGLAIAQGLARAMGGDLTVQSEPGEGSCFMLRLPARTRADIPLAGLRALVADDHPASRHVLRLILQAQGVDVVEAEDGAAALALFQAGRYDFVLLDQRMPGLEGSAARAAMHAQEAALGRPPTPIALLSAQAGPAPAIAKPVRPEALLAGIAALLATGAAAAPDRASA